jgi:ATP-binding cassette subfamily B (MDR/TAP) protein 1
MANFGSMGANFGLVMQIFGASDKIVLLVKTPQIVNSTGGETLPDTREDSNIHLKDVEFRYPSKPEVEVLKGVSVEINNKDKRVVALCGQSGCGKSSIISMIERFYDANAGQVLFNGTNIKDLQPRWYHEQISLV